MSQHIITTARFLVQGIMVNRQESDLSCKTTVESILASDLLMRNQPTVFGHNKLQKRGRTLATLVNTGAYKEAARTSTEVFRLVAVQCTQQPMNCLRKSPKHLYGLDQYPDRGRAKCIKARPPVSGAQYQPFHSGNPSLASAEVTNSINPLSHAIRNFPINSRKGHSKGIDTRLPKKGC